MRKPAFCICENKDADQLRKLRSAFVFATWIVWSLFYLNPKFQFSSHLLWLYCPVCGGPGRKPEDWFSRIMAHTIWSSLLSFSMCSSIVWPGSLFPDTARPSTIWSTKSSAFTSCWCKSFFRILRHNAATSH